MQNNISNRHVNTSAQSIQAHQKSHTKGTDQGQKTSQTAAKLSTKRNESKPTAQSARGKVPTQAGKGPESSASKSLLAARRAELKGHTRLETLEDLVTLMKHEIKDSVNFSTADVLSVNLSDKTGRSLFYKAIEGERGWQELIQDPQAFFGDDLDVSHIDKVSYFGNEVMAEHHAAFNEEYAESNRSLWKLAGNSVRFGQAKPSIEMAATKIDKAPITRVSNPDTLNNKTDVANLILKHNIGLDEVHTFLHLVAKSYQPYQPPPPGTPLKSQDYAILDNLMTHVKKEFYESEGEITSTNGATPEQMIERLEKKTDKLPSGHQHSFLSEMLSKMTKAWDVA
ncbi:hypothetical protein SCOR_07465 [Sulfidibacter corallicola]